MRNLKLAVAGVLSALTLAALPAVAAQTIVAYEIGGQPVFTGTGAPGSTIQLNAVLVNPANHSQVIGSKAELCIITAYAPGPILWCNESLKFSGGTLYAQGTVDEVALEHFAPQTISVISGDGVYRGKTGTETIQQVVYPNELLNTLVIH